MLLFVPTEAKKLKEVPKQQTLKHSCNNKTSAIAKQHTSKHDSPEDLNSKRSVKRVFFLSQRLNQRNSKTTQSAILEQINNKIP